MEDYLLNLVINILLMTFAIFSVLELIYDSSKGDSFFKKINNKGWILIFIALLSIGFNLFKDWKANSKQKLAESAKTKSDSLFYESQKEIQRLQLSSKNSIIEKVDSTYIKSLKASNEALAKYNLQISDSLNAVISKLEIDNSNPQLLLQPQEKGKQPHSIIEQNDQKVLRIQFTSIGGNCYNILLDTYIIKQTQDSQYPILGFERLEYGNSFLAENIIRSHTIFLTPEILSEPKLYVLTTGKFTKDPEGKNIVTYDEVFSYNFRDNSFITGYSTDSKKLKKLLKLPIVIE